jgi:hypothetical protein
VVRTSRIHLLIVAAVTAACLATQSILPAMFVVLPRFYGGLFSQLFNLTQHASTARFTCTPCSISNNWATSAFARMR